ncbi:hypothetical protein [Trichormus azollae]
MTLVKLKLKWNDTKRYYKSLSQKDGRIWAAIEALKVGYGGQA